MSAKNGYVAYDSKRGSATYPSKMTKALVLKTCISKC